MTDKPAVTAEAEAETLLPCPYYDECRKGLRWCRTNCRPTEFATLAAKDAQIAALEAALKLFMGTPCGYCGGDCSGANPPVSACPYTAARTASAQPGGE